VLALVDRSSSAPAETPGGEKGTAPPTTALLAAVRYAHAKGVTIGAQVSWSDDPALDIITLAQEAGVAWILLGYHRGALGNDTTGGVVREVFAKAKVLPINVGVFIQGTDRPIERVFAAVDSSPDGRASLALVYASRRGTSASFVRFSWRNACQMWKTSCPTWCAMRAPTWEKGSTRMCLQNVACVSYLSRRPDDC